MNDSQRSAPGLTVVGIGASAGGLEAAKLLLRDLPVDTGFAFVLVQHLDPTHASSLGEILGREYAAEHCRRSYHVRLPEQLLQSVVADCGCVDQHPACGAQVATDPERAGRAAAGCSEEPNRAGRSFARSDRVRPQAALGSVHSRL